MLSSLKVFYKNVKQHTKTTGSIAPSSRFLAKAMTSCIDDYPAPRRILEVGSGTGPFTDHIMHKIQPGDELHLCEINESFAQHLQHRLQTEPHWQQHQERTTLHHQPVEELESLEPFDLIISGLPFNNFEPTLVRQILSSYSRLIQPKGRLIFFEYYAVRNMKKPFASQEEWNKVSAVSNVLQEFLTSFEEKTLFVTFNLPPSIVHVCRIPHPFS